MNRGLTRYLLTAILLTLLTFGSVHANAWNNFWNNVGNAVSNYNTNVLATGDQVNEAIKNKDANAAFDNYLAGIQKTGDDALADSKALGVALKELVQSIPKAIKALWDKIVDAILKLRDKFCHGNSGGSDSQTPPPAEEPPAEDPPAVEPPAQDPPAEEPPAVEPPAEEPPAEQPPTEQPPVEETAVGELSDDPFPEDGDIPDDDGAAAPKASATMTPFVRTFASSKSFGDKLDTYNQYNQQLGELMQLVGSMEEEHRNSVASRVSFLADEVSALKAIIEKDIKEALATENNENVFIPLTHAANSQDESSMDIVRTAVRAVNGHQLEGGSQSEAVSKFMNSVRD